MSDETGNHKTCFVICPIGENGSEIRKWSDITFKFIIEPVVNKFNYEAKRADHIKESGMITNQIIEQLLESDLVIADLTTNNPNVYYELAIRHFTKKPYIQMSQIGQKIPFDINGMRTIFFDHNIEFAEPAREELYTQIQSIENGEFKSANPITLAHNYSIIQKLLQESKQEFKEENLPNVVIEAINNMTYSISQIKSSVDYLNQKVFPNNSKSFDIHSMDDAALETMYKNKQEEDFNIAFNQFKHLRDKMSKGTSSLSPEEFEEYMKLIRVMESKKDKLNKFDELIR